MYKDAKIDKVKKQPVQTLRRASNMAQHSLPFLLSTNTESPLETAADKIGSFENSVNSSHYQVCAHEQKREFCVREELVVYTKTVSSSC